MANFLYPSTIAISRPNQNTGVGTVGYGGLLPTDETVIATGIAAHIQADRQGTRPKPGQGYRAYRRAEHLEDHLQGRCGPDTDPRHHHRRAGTAFPGNLRRLGADGHDLPLRRYCAELTRNRDMKDEKPVKKPAKPTAAGQWCGRRDHRCWKV